ncbi:amidase, partial [Burkholderia pseudomallei]
FGFTPSRDPELTPWPEPGEIVVEHAVSRSVSDSALLLDITTGRTAPGTHEGVGAPGTYLCALDAPPPALKIGYVTDPML